jgi:hypothetical protein
MSDSRDPIDLELIDGEYRLVREDSPEEREGFPLSYLLGVPFMIAIRLLFFGPIHH